MAVFQKAHQALAAEVGRLEGLQALDEEIKRAGSMERLAKESEAKCEEAERRLKAKLGEIDQADEALSKALASLAGARADQKTVAADTQALVDAANEKATQILKDADEQAKARRAADDEMRLAAFAEHNRELDKIADKMAEANARLSDVHAQVAEAEQRKAAVEAEIERLKKLFLPK